MQSRDDEEPLQQQTVEQHEHVPQQVKQQVETQINQKAIDSVLKPKSDGEIAGELFCIVCCLVFPNLLLGLLFYFFSTKENYYGGDACKNLREVSYGFGSMNLIAASLLIILLLAIKFITSNIRKVDIWFQLVYFIFGIAQIVYSILLFITLFQNEECEMLRGLTFVYFWIFVLVSIVFCCSCIKAIQLFCL